MQFNAPKNFNRGKLIMGRFRLKDLLFLIAGSLISFTALIVYVGMAGGRSVAVSLALFLPGVLSYILTMPCGVYHNNLELIKLWIQFRKSEKDYIWEGIYQYDSFEEILEKYRE